MGLMPKRVKFRKAQRGKRRGSSFKGASLSFGEFGLKAMENGYFKDRQIEAARVALMRNLRGGGKVENLPMHVFQSDDGDLDSQCPAEIGITDRRERFSFHSLRHTFAGLALAVGVDGMALQLGMGHAGPQMTKHYAQAAQRLHGAVREWPRREITLRNAVVAAAQGKVVVR